MRIEKLPRAVSTLADDVFRAERFVARASSNNRAMSCTGWHRKIVLSPDEAAATAHIALRQASSVRVQLGDCRGAAWSERPSHADVAEQLTQIGHARCGMN
jgi:hypothetical protein